jgi:hypothetical protein
MTGCFVIGERFLGGMWCVVWDVNVKAKASAKARQRQGKGKSKDEIQGFFAALRMTTVLFQNDGCSVSE